MSGFILTFLSFEMDGMKISQIGLVEVTQSFVIFLLLAAEEPILFSPQHLPREGIKECCSYNCV